MGHEAGLRCWMEPSRQWGGLVPEDGAHMGFPDGAVCVAALLAPCPSHKRSLFSLGLGSQWPVRNVCGELRGLSPTWCLPVIIAPSR